MHLAHANDLGDICLREAFVKVHLHNSSTPLRQARQESGNGRFGIDCVASSLGVVPGRKLAWTRTVLARDFCDIKR